MRKTNKLTLAIKEASEEGIASASSMSACLELQPRDCGRISGWPETDVQKPLKALHQKEVEFVIIGGLAAVLQGTSHHDLDDGLTRKGIIRCVTS